LHNSEPDFLENINTNSVLFSWLLPQSTITKTNIMIIDDFQIRM